MQPSQASGTRHFPPPAFYAEVDPRLKLVLTVGVGCEIWYGGFPALLCFCAALGILHWRLGAFDRRRARTALAGTLFVFFWSLAAAGMALWQGAPLDSAVLRGVYLGGRLLALVLLGLALTASSSARELGLAASWFLRPVLGKKAWQSALALALMVHFLPQTLEALFTVRRMDAMRAPQRWFWVRWGLMAQSVLRVLAQNVLKQTTALAARGLDTPAAWEPEFAFRPAPWLAGTLLLACGAGVAAL